MPELELLLHPPHGLALLVWANLTAVALLFGVAFCGQIEAVRAGDPERAIGGDQAAPTSSHRRGPVSEVG